MDLSVNLKTKRQMHRSAFLGAEQSSPIAVLTAVFIKCLDVVPVITFIGLLLAVF